MDDQLELTTWRDAALTAAGILLVAAVYVAAALTDVGPLDTLAAVLVPALLVVVGVALFVYSRTEYVANLVAGLLFVASGAGWIYVTVDPSALVGTAPFAGAAAAGFLVLLLGEG